MERMLRDEIAIEVMKYWLQHIPLVSKEHDEIVKGCGAYFPREATPWQAKVSIRRHE